MCVFRGWLSDTDIAVKIAFLFRCDERYDHITAHVLIGVRMSKIDDFCGAETPPQLMSTRNFLTIQFIAKSSRTHREKSERNTGRRYRFLLHYEFVTDLGLGGMKATRDITKSMLHTLSIFTTF